MRFMGEKRGENMKIQELGVLSAGVAALGVAGSVYIGDAITAVSCLTIMGLSLMLMILQRRRQNYGNKRRRHV